MLEIKILKTETSVKYSETVACAKLKMKKQDTKNIAAVDWDKEH
jgi:hypothetical protein